MRRVRAVAWMGVASAWTATAFGQGGGGPPPANVMLDAVREEVIDQLRPVTGEVRSRLRSNVAAEEPGFVLEMLVREGDAIERGAVIARLDDRLAKLSLESARAEAEAARATVAEIEAQLDEARRELSRRRDAQARASVSQSELESAESSVAAWEARLARAHADVAAADAGSGEAEKRLNDMTILAPFNGRVVSKGAEVGQWVERGDTVALVVSLDELEARLDVPQRLSGVVREGGTPVRLRITALGEEITAPVSRVIPDVDPLSRLYPALVDLKADVTGEIRALLKPGMSVVGLVPTGSMEPTLTISKDAVLRDDAGEFAYFDADGVAMAARIETMFAVGDRVAIRRGRLQPGMRVVVEGNERLYPTQPLNVLNPGAQGAAAPDANAGGAGGASHGG